MKKLKRTRDYVRYGDNQTVDIVGNLKVNGKDVEHKTDIIREKADGTVQFAPIDAKATGIVVKEGYDEILGYDTSTANVISKYGRIRSDSIEVHSDDYLSIRSVNEIGGNYGTSTISADDIIMLSADGEEVFDEAHKLYVLSANGLNGLQVLENTHEKAVVLGIDEFGILINNYNGNTILGFGDVAEYMYGGEGEMVTFTLEELKKLKELISNG